MKKNKIGNLVLLCGVEEFLVKWADGLLRDRFVAKGMEALDLSEIDGTECETGDIVSACETMPMMSERRVVVVRDLSVLWKNSSKHITPEAAKELAGYLEKIPEYTLLILEGGKDPERNGSRSYVLDAVARSGQKYDFGLLSREQLRGFILKRFRASGKTAGAGVVESIMDKSGYFSREDEYTLYNMESDIRKMVALSQGDEITENEAAAAISDSLEHDSFKMMNAICERRKDDAFRQLHYLLRSGANSFQLIGYICSEMELMLETKELAGMGRSIGEMISATGVKSDYRIRKALGHAGMFAESELRRILVSAFEMDNLIKDGLLDEEAALEMFIANV
ncbi:MAG: DNA polymerase III subunit delta [Anaerovoracaceae bacterium]